MSTVPVTTLVGAIVNLFTEAYAGPPNPKETWFIDNEPNAGILGILAGVSAVEASISPGGSGLPGSTIAANVEHLRWSLANLNATLRGAAFNGNWKESWALLQTDAAGWDRLRQNLRTEFENLCEALKQQQELEGEYLPGLLAILPHAAYHLGTIRQLVERVRQ